MIRNYLKVALRTLRRQKGFAAINVLGLAVGIAACLLMGLYVRHELSYDQFHEKADRLFRVLNVVERESDGTRTVLAQQPRPLAPALAAAFPQVERVVEINRAQPPNAVRRGQRVFEENILTADSTFFEVFSFPLAQGDPARVLDRPASAVLSAEAAEKYFGSENPVGQRLEVRLQDTFYDVTVTGVARPLPSNSSITFDVLLSRASGAGYGETFARANWGTLSPRLYVELSSPQAAKDLEAQLPAFLERVAPENQRRPLRLQPLTDVHYATDVQGSLAPAIDPVFVRILGGVAFFVLLIACINFTTLAVGRSAGRIREVGMRKALGAVRAQLMRQFWGEALLTSLAAAVLGLGIARAGLPAFERLVGKELALGLTPLAGVVLAGGLVLTALVAGAYPAVYLSKFRPAEVLTGRFRPGGRTRLTRALVVVQLTLAGALVIVTLVMARQMQFLQERDLGFDRAQVVRLDVPMQESVQTWQRLHQQLTDDPSVQSVSASWNQLGGGAGVGFDAGPPAQTGAREVEAAQFNVSPGALETLGLEVVRGCAPQQLAGREAPPVLVNEAFVEAAGWNAPLGQTVTMKYIGPENARVVGVVKDFHFESLHAEIRPLLLRMSGPFSTLYVRTAPGQTRMALDQIEAAWGEAAPDIPFSFTFMDEAVEAQYRVERRWARTVTGAAGLALFITAMGLVGLAALAVQRRTKEIAVRKALGASARSVVALLSKDFLGPVALGFALAVPLAGFAASRWLERFAYHAELRPWLFLAAGALVFLVATAATGWQAFRAARTNPAQALRDE